MQPEHQNIPEEIPVISIERIDDETHVSDDNSRTRKLIIALIVIASLALALIVAYLVRKQCQRHTDVGVPVSVTAKQNLHKLQNPAGPNLPPRIIADSFIYDDACFMTYRICGLNQTDGKVYARLELSEPDTADQTVLIYSRSADHKADGSYLASIVVQGMSMPYVAQRYGYMAMQGNSLVMGISKSEKLYKYALDNNGSFFRQYVLLSDYSLPKYYDLKGEQYRNAYATTDGDDLYYVKTTMKMRMEDFAVALQQQGFRDAVYITGGDDYSYYRDTNLIRHDIGDIQKYPHWKWRDTIPWLVFRLEK